MKKYLSSFLFFFLCCNLAFCQKKDSVQTLFTNSPHLRIPLHYSYLQWELCYTGFNFSNTYLNGASIDLFGLVFNDDFGVAIGIDEAGNSFGFAPINTVISYSSLYLKFEPMLFPDKLINIAIPLKFSTSDLTFASLNNQSAYGGYGGRGHGRKGGNPGDRFFAFSPGADIFVNIFKGLSLGGGMNYRLAFSEPGVGSHSDYDNISVSGILRLKLFTRKTHPKNTNDYYTPPQRFQ